MYISFLQFFLNHDQLTSAPELGSVSGPEFAEVPGTPVDSKDGRNVAGGAVSTHGYSNPQRDPEKWTVTSRNVNVSLFCYDLLGDCCDCEILMG